MFCRLGPHRQQQPPPEAVYTQQQQWLQSVRAPETHPGPLCIFFPADRQQQALPEPKQHLWQQIVRATETPWRVDPAVDDRVVAVHLPRRLAPSSALESFSLIDARQRRNHALIVPGSFYYVLRCCTTYLAIIPFYVPCTTRVTGWPLLLRAIDYVV